MENNCRTYKAIGKVDPQVIKQSYWDILDLSQAVGVSAKENRASFGYTLIGSCSKSNTSF